MKFAVMIAASMAYLAPTEAASHPATQFTKTILTSAVEKAAAKIEVLSGRKLQTTIDPSTMAEIKKQLDVMKSKLQPCMAAYDTWGYLGCSLDYTFDDLLSGGTGDPFAEMDEETLAQLEGGNLTSPTAAQCSAIFDTPGVQCLALMNPTGFENFAKAYPAFTGKETECAPMFELPSILSEGVLPAGEIGTDSTDGSMDGSDTMFDDPSVKEGFAAIEKLKTDCETAEPGVTSSLVGDYSAAPMALVAPAFGAVLLAALA